MREREREERERKEREREREREESRAERANGFFFPVTAAKNSKQAFNRSGPRFGCPSFESKAPTNNL